MAGRIISASPVNDAGSLHALHASDNLIDGRYDDLVGAAAPADRHRFGILIKLTLEMGRFRIRIDRLVDGEKQYTRRAADHDGIGTDEHNLQPAATVASMARSSATGPGISVGLLNAGGAFSGSYGGFPPIPNPRDVSAGFSGYVALGTPEVEVTVQGRQDEYFLFVDLPVRDHIVMRRRFLTTNTTRNRNRYASERGVLFLNSASEQRVELGVTLGFARAEGIVLLYSVE